ncbi:MAG TPA: MlaD family protein [Bryobacteraceae bacterium]|nr:MlaD family protein [Bryobacteraceae bacterium]
MPDRSKVRWSQLKVGIVALTAIIITGVMIFLLTSKTGLFKRNILLRTYMEDASGMQDGTAVRLNGITVGYLDSLRLTNSTNPKRVVEFDMLVEERYQNDIPVDSVAGISAANLLGDKFVNIVKGSSSEHVHDGSELPSLTAQDIPELMAQSANLLQSFQTIVGRVDKLLAGVEEGQGNIGKFLKDQQLYDRFNNIEAEVQKLLTDVRTGGGTISKLIYDDSLYQQIQSPLKRIDAILAELDAGRGTAGKLMKDPALYDDATQIATEIKTLVANLNAGKGTAGKLLNDDQLHQRLDQLVTQLNSTIDRINSGQGTIGQLLTNPQLYDTLNSATHEFQGLAKGILANPKKFLRIKLALF